MRTLRALSLVLLAAAALPLAAAKPVDVLALVPPEAGTVGMLRLSDLRSSPLFATLFSEADRLVVDGDMARFSKEARLNVKEDVDTLVLAGSPKGEGKGSAFMAFEGRFDPAALLAAVTSHGAQKRSSAHGDYYVLPGGKGGPGDPQREPLALAMPDGHVVVAGNEDAVVKALARRGQGGSGFTGGSGIGRHLSRVNTGSSAWMIVDTSRFPAMKEKAAKINLSGEVDGGGGNGGSVSIAGAMKSVSLLTFQASVDGDSVALDVAGLSDDAETRELLEDTLRGALAAWRLSAQEKSPEIVQALRKFKVERDDEGVSIKGKLSGDAVQKLISKKRDERASKDK